jgi:hypothetical protein
VPLSIVFVIVFGSIMYWMTNFDNDSNRFGFFLLVLWLLGVVTGSAPAPRLPHF